MILRRQSLSRPRSASPPLRAPSPSRGEGKSVRLARETSTRLLRLHLVPPRTDAGHAVVVAVEHLHRLAQPRFGGLDAEQARFLALLRRHPAAVVAPKARAVL